MHSRLLATLVSVSRLLSLAPAKIILDLLAVVLLAAAFSPRAQAQQRDSAARLAPLTDQLRLGAEYFPEPHRHGGKRSPPLPVDAPVRTDDRAHFHHLG